MEILIDLLSIEQTLFAVFGYKISLIEFVGTSFGLISVWLATKVNFHTWTTGILNVTLFFVIYYQVQLYSDMFLQIFFLGTSFLGIWQWQKKSLILGNKHITFVKQKYLPALLGSIILISILLGFLMALIHLYFPDYFKISASYPYADALTTILSIYATFLMVYKKVECWILWLVVDIISIILYFQKGLLFIAFEYSLFLALAIVGLYQWIKLLRYVPRINFR